jgi:glycosyltransferase involved in cell wall biosynthesis
MFEFIQAELPILANNLPGLQRFVGDNGFGRLVTMDAPEAIAAGLDEMLAAPEELMAIRRRLAAGKSAFSWRKQAEKYMRLVAAATEGPDGRPGFA